MKRARRSNATRAAIHAWPATVMWPDAAPKMMAAAANDQIVPASASPLDTTSASSDTMMTARSCRSRETRWQPVSPGEVIYVRGRLRLDDDPPTALQLSGELRIGNTGKRLGSRPFGNGTSGRARLGLWRSRLRPWRCSLRLRCCSLGSCLLVHRLHYGGRAIAMHAFVCRSPAVLMLAQMPR